MTNKFTLRFLSLVLLLAILASALFACVDIPAPNFSGTTSNSGTSTTPTAPTVPTNTSSTTTSSTTTSTVIRPGSTSSSGGGVNTPDDDHTDVDNNGFCDDCGIDVVERIDFYNFNDLHGKFEDGDNHPGVDEATTYLENRKEIDEHVVILSTGDMWQGGSASNATHGRIITDWMNYLGFEAMALGNHEFDWGVDAIRENAELAEFPILAINVYDNATGQRADFCEPSVMIERGGAQIGIIGAIGDCYSSISFEHTKGYHFKVKDELTALVKEESAKLREAGADVIVYLIHDGTTYSSVDVTDYYDETLSRDGYIDVVFGGHTHSYYVTTDAYGVPHLQGGGDNSKGMTHVDLDVNFANGEIKINISGYVQHSQYQNFEPSFIVENLIDKYWDEIGWIYEGLGYNATTRNSSAIGNTVVKLYYEAGIEKWGDKYDIVLAGGQINARSPYNIYAGNVQYSDIQMVLPFDNPLYLCRIKGSDLKSKFLNNSDYYKYSTISASQVNNDQYYYIVADSWTALYAWAKCEAIELYDENTFARDFLAEYIKQGGWSK